MKQETIDHLWKLADREFYKAFENNDVESGDIWIAVKEYLFHQEMFVGPTLEDTWN